MQIFYASQRLFSQFVRLAAQVPKYDGHAVSLR